METVIFLYGVRNAIHARITKDAPAPPREWGQTTKTKPKSLSDGRTFRNGRLSGSRFADAIRTAENPSADVVSDNYLGRPASIHFCVMPRARL